MRALLMGSAGIVLLVGSVAAQEPVPCSAERNLILIARTAEIPSPDVKVALPDLVGKEFSIVRLHHRGHMSLVELKSGEGRYWLTNEVTPRTTPGSFFQSYKPGDRSVSRALVVAPAHKSSQQAQSFSAGYAFSIKSGPLSGLDLDVKGCRLKDSL